jgi:hypothetical protein
MHANNNNSSINRCYNPNLVSQSHQQQLVVVIRNALVIAGGLGAWLMFDAVLVSAFTSTRRPETNQLQCGQCSMTNMQERIRRSLFRIVWSTTTMAHLNPYGFLARQ